MNHRYAYLKPDTQNSPFYVHLTLKEDTKKLRIYYHCSWWKKERVEPHIFEYWMQQFAGMMPMLTHIPSSKKKSPVCVKRNSVKVKGKCKIFATMLKDLIGFVEKDTSRELSAVFYGYANQENKLIEAEIEMDYAELGSLVPELRQMGIFSSDPDREYVRSRLTFFKMSYVVGSKHSALSIPELQKSQHVGSPAEVIVTPTTIVEEFQLDPNSCPGSRLKPESSEK